MMRPRKPDARLARGADGTLSEPERRELERQLETSPELTSELELQQQALSLMRGLDAEQAPAELHASVQALIAAERAPQPRARSRVWRLAPAAVAAVAVIALVAVILSSGSSSTPSVNKAAQLALLRPTEPSPAESPGRSATLTRAVGGISFPYWRHELGWSTSGARNDSYGGRSATTVFYTGPNGSGGTARVGYTILSGTALPLPNGAGVVERGGTRYYVLGEGGATVVTWRRNGHTCHPRRPGGPPGHAAAPRRLGLADLPRGERLAQDLVRPARFCLLDRPRERPPAAFQDGLAVRDQHPLERELEQGRQQHSEATAIDAHVIEPALGARSELALACPSRLSPGTRAATPGSQNTISPAPFSRRALTPSGTLFHGRGPPVPSGSSRCPGT